jgi:hypothetical protein
MSALATMRHSLGANDPGGRRARRSYPTPGTSGPERELTMREGAAGPRLKAAKWAGSHRFAQRQVAVCAEKAVGTARWNARGRGVAGNRALRSVRPKPEWLAMGR